MHKFKAMRLIFCCCLALMEANISACGHSISSGLAAPASRANVLSAPAHLGTAPLFHNLVTFTSRPLSTDYARFIAPSQVVSSLMSSPPAAGGQAGPISTTDVPTSITQAKTQIKSVLNGDWKYWAGSLHARLSLSEIEQLVSNPQITGSQASNIGMIALRMDNDVLNRKMNNPMYSLPLVKALLLSKFQNYTSIMGQIASATNSDGSFNLYGSFSGPELTTIQQGSVLGNCFFLAGINSSLNQNPQSVAGMIAQNGNGTFTVTFPLTSQYGQPTQQTINLTDSYIAVMSPSQNNGAWLTVMGMAVNQFLVQLANAGVEPYAQRLTPIIKAAPFGPLGIGGYPSDMIPLLTNQGYVNLSYTDTSLWNKTFVSQLLTQLVTSQNPVPINVNSNGHALSIISYNTSTQVAVILNPWGTSGVYGYRQDAGIRNKAMSVHMTNGMFLLTVPQILSDFSTLTVPNSSIPPGKLLELINLPLQSVQTVVKSPVKPVVYSSCVNEENVIDTGDCDDTPLSPPRAANIL